MRLKRAAMEMVEFAVVLPILMVMLLGIMSFARAYNVYTTITYAAQEGARVAAASTCATCGPPPSATTVASNVANRVDAGATGVKDRSWTYPNVHRRGGRNGLQWDSVQCLLSN